MFSLTNEERRVVLFLGCIALLGLGINFALKANPRLTRLIRVEKHITRIDINKATFEDLSGSRAVTAKLAKAILEYRASRGIISDIEELKEIKGIGEARCEKLKDAFFVE